MSGFLLSGRGGFTIVTGYCQGKACHAGHFTGPRQQASPADVEVAQYLRANAISPKIETLSIGPSGRLDRLVPGLELVEEQIGRGMTVEQNHDSGRRFGNGLHGAGDGP